MSNKIKAAIRVRPFLSSEVKNGYKNNRVLIDQSKKQLFVQEDNTKRSFHFDYLFAEESSQEDVYTGCKVDHMIDKAIEGYHSTIFAYGQTGSGKTHTMQGTQSIEQNKKSTLDGLIPKVIGELYKKIKSINQRTFIISVSFLQIYNEKIFDLLNPASLNSKNVGTNVNGLRLRWNKDEQFSVQNLFVFECKDQDELTKYFLYGLKNRISSAHKLNVQSSRSHSILTLRVESFHHSNPSHLLCSKIQLVDLAGSERIGMTGTQGKLAKQSIDINKSLFTLRQVISILADAGKSKGKQKGYVPYRDSKLTSILKQSIGGNSYSLMIACINPNDAFIQQNLSTLTYATKASYITNQPVINDDPRSKIIAQLKKQVRNLTEQLSKANEHIEMITNMNQNHIRNPKGKPSTQYSQRLEDHEEVSIPEPIFKKKGSDKISGTQGNQQFSERLVQSINMVRQLLKSNKELREQLEASHQRADEKDIQIYQLSRQNQEFKERLQSDNPLPITEDSRRSSNSNFRPRNTTQSHFPSKNQANTANMGNTGNNGNTGTGNSIANGNIYGFQTANSKNNFNYWNSVEINQYYMNERGIDSMPTNFNRREVNSAQNNRIIIQSRGNSAQRNDRHAVTAKISKRNWMSKNSEPKKFLSFYNDPNKEGNFY